MELGYTGQALIGTWEVSSYPRAVKPQGHGFVSIDLVVGGGPLAKDGLTRISTDGLNEYGLTVSAHTLETAQYQVEPEAGTGPEKLSFLKVLPSLLRNATNVDEAVAYVRQHAVVSSPPSAQAIAGGLHWGVSDASGRSVVLEFIEGRLMVHNNTVGVMTNDPSFAWHLLNLNTHVNLRQTWPAADDNIQVQTEVGPVPSVMSHGYNLAGLPGDSSPPARFTRLFYLRQFATSSEPPQSVDDAIVLGTNLINNVVVIKGTVAAKGRFGKVSGVEYVPYAVIKIPSRRVFMYRSYTDMQWKSVDLNNIDFSAGDKVVAVEVPRGLNVVDVTGSFNGTR